MIRSVCADTMQEFDYVDALSGQTQGVPRNGVGGATEA